MRGLPPGPTRTGLVLATISLLLAASCGGEEEQAGGSHLSLQFSGAVTGSLDSDVDVDCFLPAEPGGTFSVSVDSEDGVVVGARTLKALDFSTNEYSGPKTYDVGEAMKTGGFLGESFFLLFEELEEQPFLWGAEQGSSGTVTVDPSERSGRISLRGWENVQKLRVDAEGTFRCGEKEEKG